MMTLNETFEKDIPVVVQLVGVPKNVVITQEISDTIYVTVRDKGFVLLTYGTTRRLHPIQLNFNAYANKQTGRGQIPVSDIQKLVRQQLFAYSPITTVKAETLTFYFNYGQKKKVKVKLTGNINPSKNYYLAHYQFSPNKVTIYASKKLLDSIQFIQTEYLNIVGFSDTVVQNVRLKKLRGVKIVPSVTKLTLYPDILAEKTIEVPIHTINTPDGIVIQTFPKRVKVTFAIGASMYRTVDENDFRVVVNYNDIVNHPSDKCKLYLQAKPAEVSNARLQINQVDYLIEGQ